MSIDSFIHEAEDHQLLPCFQIWTMEQNEATTLDGKETSEHFNSFKSFVLQLKQDPE